MRNIFLCKYYSNILEYKRFSYDLASLDFMQSILFLESRYHFQRDLIVNSIHFYSDRPAKVRGSHISNLDSRQFSISKRKITVRKSRTTLNPDWCPIFVRLLEIQIIEVRIIEKILYVQQVLVSSSHSSPVF